MQLSWSGSADEIVLANGINSVLTWPARTDADSQFSIPPRGARHNKCNKTWRHSWTSEWETLL